MDAHLARMLASARQCRCCGATFSQLLSLGCDRPDLCPEDLVVQDNSAILAQSGDVLTDDFCRLGDLRFIRAILALPIANSRGEEFTFGTWANIGAEDFETYLDLLDLQDTESMGSRPAWLANAIPPETESPVACMLHMRPDGQYPDLQISEPNHPLATLQTAGAQLEELLELLFAYGHDLASLVYDS